MTHHKPTRQWVTGATSSQQFSVTLSLAEELLDLKEARSLTALRSLGTFLSSRMELLTSDVMALAPPQRAAHIIGYVRSMKDSRPSGGSSSSDDVFSSASSGGKSSSQIGYIFKATRDGAQLTSSPISTSTCLWLRRSRVSRRTRNAACQSRFATSRTAPCRHARCCSSRSRRRRTRLLDQCNYNSWRRSTRTFGASSARRRNPISTATTCARGLTKSTRPRTPTCRRPSEAPP